MKKTRKALFLDRDGVINVNHGYVHKPEDCDFVSGIFELCRAAHQKGYCIIIVTNQSGIARSYYSNHQFRKFSHWMKAQFSKQGVSIHDVLHCPHHPKITGFCTCRKPMPGMLFEAARKHRISLKQSIMVGDSWSDVVCSRRAGIGKSVLFKDPTFHQDFINPIFPNVHIERAGRFYKARNLSSIANLL